MQAQSVLSKTFGHRRRPSIGKSLPMTSLILNFPALTEGKDYNIVAEDEVPSNCFQLLKVDEFDKKIRSHDHSTKQEKAIKVPITEILNDLAPNPTPGSSEYDKLSDSKNKAVVKSLKNTENLEENNNSLECPRITKKMPSKVDEQRKEFLTNLLTNGESNNDGLDINDNEDGDLNTIMNLHMEDLREKFAIVEALAKTSMMTSPAAKRRLAARKIEMECDQFNSNPFGSDDEKEFTPPREVLLYLVRMGSFNSAPKINNTDSQDDALEIPSGLTRNDMVEHCKLMRGDNRPQLLERKFLKPIENSSMICNDITDGLRVLKLNSVSKVCSNPKNLSKQLRILQWNILSQTLGQNNDGFVQCPDEALTWDNRKYLIVEEIIRNNPDVICLQEVDHFKFLQRVLRSQNYNGIFFPKPDSPCLYIEENNGPDGCAVFYKRDKFELLESYTRILEVWRVQSNQVAIAANFKVLDTEKELCICTTHLKARNGALLSKLRNEQGKDLLRFLSNIADGRPILLCGDFNAEPIEPVYGTVLNYKGLGLGSAYADIMAKEGHIIRHNVQKQSLGCYPKKEYKESKTNDENGRFKTTAEVSAMYEPPYTTWKIREEGEVCHTIDYVFYSKKNLKVTNCLLFPEEEEIGKDRTPSFQYPSDHFSLVCDFEIYENN